MEGRAGIRRTEIRGMGNRRTGNTRIGNMRTGNTKPEEQGGGGGHGTGNRNWSTENSEMGNRKAGSRGT